MAEQSEETQDAGTWYCGRSKQPVTVLLIQREPNHFEIVCSCSSNHNLKFILESPDLVYLDEAGLRKLAEAYMILQLADVDSQGKDIFRATLLKAMIRVSGLSDKICESIITSGIQKGPVRVTQEPVREKVGKGTSVLTQEVTIDEEEE